jgi:ATP-dependent Zn protease
LHHKKRVLQIFRTQNLLIKVKDNQIESVLIEADGKTISGTYNNGTSFLTYGLNDPKLVDDLLSNNIEILTEPPAKPSLFLQILNSMVPNVASNRSLVILYETNARWRQVVKERNVIWEK